MHWLLLIVSQTLQKYTRIWKLNVASDPNTKTKLHKQRSKNSSVAKSLVNKNHNSKTNRNRRNWIYQALIIIQYYNDLRSSTICKYPHRIHV